MTSQTRFRNKKKIVLAAVAVSLAVVVLLASLAYLHFFDASPFWEGGKWSDRQTQNFGWPQPVEFQGKLYMFYSAITKDTNTYTSDALQPSEYFLYDTFYRTFDGENFSDAVAVSAPTDEVSTQGGYFVYDGKLYALLTEKWIVNYTSYEWTSQVKLKWLDGDSWREVPSSFSQGETYYGLKALIGGDKAWLIWVQPESNVFSFKTFIGTAWSETRNATFPTSAPNNPSFTVVDGKLWATWENQTVRQGPPVFHTHEDIYVGSFDGENWSNVTWLNMPDDDSTNLRPFMTSYQGARFVFWESEYFLPSALAMRRVYDNDSLSQLTVVNPSGKYSSGNAGACEYAGKLYVFWNYRYQCMIRSFNGSEWSSVYTLGDMTAENAFVHAGKLWIYSSQGSSRSDKTMLRNYEITGQTPIYPSESSAFPVRQNVS